jgi:hypothetical protein
MKENQNPFDEHLQRRLSDHESPVSNDLFDRLQARRGGALSSDAPLRERLEGHESFVPTDMFDRLQAQRGGDLLSDAPLRKRLEGHESPVSEKVFDAILVERERRKRRVWLWRSAAAIAAMLLIGALLFQFKIKNLELNNTELNTPKTIVNSVNTEGSNSELINKNTELNTPKTIVNSANTEGSNSNLINKNSELNAPKTIVNSANTEGSNSELMNKNSELNTPKTIVNSVNTEGSNSELINKNSELNTAKTIVNSANTEGSNSKLINKNSELNTPKTIVNSANTEGSNSELINKNSELNTALENRLTPFNSTIKSLNFLNIITPRILSLAANNRKNPCSDPGNGCPTFGLRRRGMGKKAFYVDAFVAPEYAMRSFKKNLQESEKLLAARDSVEKTQYAISTGVRASLVFGNGLALRAGAVYNQMNERARFDSLGLGSITTTYNEVVQPNGKRDTVSITRTITDGIYRKIRYNHYRSIDIPLQIGYEMSLKNGWTIGFNGGANLNITAWRKADIVGADLRQLTVSSGINKPNSVFNTRLGVSIIGSVAAYRQLTDGLQLVIEPSIRYGLKPITRVDYALKQQYSTAGLIVGLRLKL